MFKINYKKLSVKSTVLIIIMTSSFMLETSVKAQYDLVVTIDGNIEVDEYEFPFSVKDGLYLLYWKVVSNQINFAMTAKTTGYIGLNIAPCFILSDADLYYGFVNGSGDYMVDTYSDTVTGPTKPDIDDGGMDDIIEFAGVEEDGTNTFEFSRLLVTGDSSHDNSISLEGTKVSWTTGPSDNIGDRPADSGRVDINFETGESEEVTDYTIYYIIGGVTVVVLVISFFLFRFIRKRKSSSLTA